MVLSNFLWQVKVLATFDLGQIESQIRLSISYVHIVEQFFALEIIES
jgi:hypothetical protein